MKEEEYLCICPFFCLDERSHPSKQRLFSAQSLQTPNSDDCGAYELKQLFVVTKVDSEVQSHQFV